MENIAGSGPLNSVAFKVIDVAEMEGWTLDLVRAARIANPGNASLHQIAEMLTLSSTRELQPAALNFEKIVRDGAPFLDPSAFRSKLGRIEQQVCSIELNGVGHGSGVLVGPDYVLTNHHVVSKATKDTKLACRFDFAASADGKVINQGHTVDVAPDIVDSSPPSANDPNLTKGDPSDDELDYALLRLVRDVGNEPAGSGNNPDAPVRGWTQLAPNALNINDPLLVLQHPQNPVSWKLEPLKLTMGRTLDVVGGGTPPAARRQHPSRIVGLAVLLGDARFRRAPPCRRRLAVCQGRLQSGDTRCKDHRSHDTSGSHSILEGPPAAIASAGIGTKMSRTPQA